MFRIAKISVPLSIFLMLATCIDTSKAEQVTTIPVRQTTDELKQKRYIAAGDRAYIIGTTDGRFPPMGWHVKGEMGGVWTHPLKLLDGYWFAVNDTWLPSAERFTTQPGYIQMDFPQTEGFEVSRTEFAPDGLPVVLVKMTIRNPNRQERSLKLILEAHSEIKDGVWSNVRGWVQKS